MCPRSAWRAARSRSDLPRGDASAARAPGRAADPAGSPRVAARSPGYRAITRMEHPMHRPAVMTTATDVRDRLRARRTQLLARYRDAGDRADEELATPARDP